MNIDFEEFELIIIRQLILEASENENLDPAYKVACDSIVKKIEERA